MRVARWEQRNSGTVREGLVDSAHREDTRRGMKGHYASACRLCLLRQAHHENTALLSPQVVTAEHVICGQRVRSDHFQIFFSFTLS